MLMDISALKPYWGQWNTRDATRLIIGSLPGVLLATWFYSIADAQMLKLLLGLISIGFVAFQLARQFGILKGRDKEHSAIVGD